jgi:hypothetical protein
MTPELQAIYNQAQALQGSVNTLSSAQQAGMQVGSQTTVQQAQQFLGGQNTSGFNNLKEMSIALSPKSGIVSSSSPTQQTNTTNAITEAGNRLTASPYQNDMGMTPFMQQQNQMTQMGMGMIDQHMKQSMQITQMAKQSLDMTYNANLAAMNHQYGQLFQQMASQHEKMVQVAEFNAQSLNPYSQAAGAQTAASFTNEITRKYQQQSMALQQQADVAQRQLQAGHFEAYVNLQKNMADQQQKFQQQMMGFMMENMKVQEDARRFEVGERRANIGQYVNFLSQPLPTPQEIEAMSDQELMQLTAVQQGLRSGYDINGIRQDLLNASNMQMSQAAMAAEDRQMKWAEFESNQAYRKAQIDNIYNQIQARNKDGAGTTKPLTWNQYINMRMQESQMSFTPEQIEQERQVFFTLYSEKGMPTYDEKSLPGTIRSDILSTLRMATEKGDEMTLEKLARYYPEVSGEVLSNLLLENYTEPAAPSTSFWSNFSYRGAQ